jgi:hypothetical protein
MPNEGEAGVNERSPLKEEKITNRPRLLHIIDFILTDLLSHGMQNYAVFMNHCHSN